MRSGRTLVAMACFAALATACGQDAPTGIILEIRSNLDVPAEVDRLTVSVRSRGRPLFQRDYPLGIEPGKWTLPSSLALAPAASPNGSMSIEAIGQLGNQLMIARILGVSFVPDEVHRVALDLDRDCLGVVCLLGKTCVPGAGCVAVDTEPSAPPPSRGPACNCQDHFPLCVGATWTYDQISTDTRLTTSKTYVISDHGLIDSTAHDKAGRNAFLQFRLANGGVTRRWLGLEGEPGARRLTYEKDDHFNTRWSAVLSTYFVPGKVRLDETRTTVGETWTTLHVQYDYRADVLPDPPLQVTDRWKVIEPDIPIRVRSRYSDLLCHERSVVVEDLVGTPQIYCFARGVGKVYENTPEDDEEILQSYKIPGCGEATR